MECIRGNCPYCLGRRELYFDTEIYGSLQPQSSRSFPCPNCMNPDGTPLPPLLLQGHSYAPGQLGDVLEAEARAGRVVAVAIEHDGGWAVSGREEVEAR